MDAKAIRNVAIIAARRGGRRLRSGGQRVGVVRQPGDRDRAGDPVRLRSRCGSTRCFASRSTGSAIAGAAVLYGSIGLVVFALAARRELVDSGGGTLAFIA